MHASRRRTTNSQNLLASVGCILAPAAIQCQMTDPKTQEEVPSCELSLKARKIRSLMNPGVFEASQEARRAYLRKFWSRIYDSSAPATSNLPLKEDLAFIKEDTPLARLDMSFLFVVVCGLSPLFDMDPKTGRVTFTDKGVSADFSLFDTCDITMLEKLSAWHWLQMYDYGFLERTINPSVILSCLGLNDRLQYLRQMTSIRSVSWLEQARWAAVDCMGEAVSQSSTCILTDMSLLLQLLETRGHWDPEYLERRALVVQLGLYFISTIRLPKRSLMTNYILQAFNAIRCDALDSQHAHRDGLRALTLEMDSQRRLVGVGWNEYASAMGITPPPVDRLLVALQSGGSYPLFLNPFLLAGHKWAEVKDSPSFRGYNLSIRWTEHRFPCENSLFDLSRFVEYEALPSSIAALRSATPYRLCSPDEGPSAPISSRGRLDGSSTAMDLRSRGAITSRTLDAVRRLITRFDCSHFLDEFSNDTVVHHAIRKQLATALVAGCNALPSLPAAISLPENESNHLLAPLVRAGCLCFCVHGFQREEIIIATERMFSLYINEMPTWQEAGPHIERWWELVCPDRQFNRAAESYGYVYEMPQDSACDIESQAPKLRNPSTDSNSTQYSTASDEPKELGSTVTIDKAQADNRSERYRLRADKLLRTLQRRRSAAETLNPQPSLLPLKLSNENKRSQKTRTSTTRQKYKHPKVTTPKKSKNPKKTQPEVMNTGPVIADEHNHGSLAAQPCQPEGPPAPALINYTQKRVHAPVMHTSRRESLGACFPVGQVQVFSNTWKCHSV
ncbi:MAG: hypothetical protein KVP17_001423 [Porospora cf. gigantea B]|uniref:uncharacterized protein n=1 Tax=Porospora cf. gigantea B TaxID=2853592 RepID=UPI003571C65E|nr:MAG: hypothetical protein KVP17_001423 [Porospora cf. gigantea B]